MHVDSFFICPSAKLFSDELELELYSWQNLL
jgi:hypothetical protein